MNNGLGNYAKRQTIFEFGFTGYQKLFRTMSMLSISDSLRLVTLT